MLWGTIKHQLILSQMVLVWINHSLHFHNHLNQVENYLNVIVISFKFKIIVFLLDYMNQGSYNQPNQANHQQPMPGQQIPPGNYDPNAFMNPNAIFQQPIVQNMAMQYTQQVKPEYLPKFH